MFLFALLISFGLAAQEKVKSTEQFVSDADKEIPRLLNDFSVPGAAIAIIENGEVVLQKGYGYADAENKIKVNTNTGFNIGSISKTIAAWGVMKLVQEGKIELDAPAEKYLTRWQLPKSDFNSEEVTIRRLLSHTAGLSLHGYPGWTPKDTLPTIEESLDGKNNGPGGVEIILEPGTQYKYSGGGFTMLQLIIEEVTGQKFEDYMQAEILDPLGMTNSSYKIDDGILSASALEYDNYGEKIDFELFTAQAAAGLHVTIEDFTKFAFASLYRNEDHQEYSPVLSADAVRQMMEPSPATNGRYGLGYQVLPLDAAFVTLRGHGGDNTGWHALLYIIPETNDGFMMVTNGGNGKSIVNMILCDWVYWKTGVTLGWYCEVKPPVTGILKKKIDSLGIDRVDNIYKELKENYPDKYDYEEHQLNTMGYHYISKDEMDKALAIFKLNIDAYPDAYNTYDSYGEAFLIKGDTATAIENYRKSIKLNPGNNHGIGVLKKLGISIDDLIVKLSIEELKVFEGDFLPSEQYEEADGEWKIEFEVVEGELWGKDGNYKFRLLPTGDNRFVNPENGFSLRFDIGDPNAIFMTLFDKFKFKKLN